MCIRDRSYTTQDWRVNLFLILTDAVLLQRERTCCQIRVELNATFSSVSKKLKVCLTLLTYYNHKVPEYLNDCIPKHVLTCHTKQDKYYFLPPEFVRILK